MVIYLKVIGGLRNILFDRENTTHNYRHVLRSHIFCQKFYRVRFNLNCLTYKQFSHQRIILKVTAVAAGSQQTGREPLSSVPKRSDRL